MKIVVINGMPRAGKDQFVTYCQHHSTWCFNFSTVDFVKEIAAKCGWDGTKTPKNREFLANLKDLLTTWGDVPFNKIKRSIQLARMEMEGYGFDSDKEGIVFIHCREPEEIAKFVRELDAKTLLIRRPAVEDAEQSNAADSGVFAYEYDYTIDNSGSLAELEYKAIQFLEMLKD